MIEEPFPRGVFEGGSLGRLVFEGTSGRGVSDEERSKLLLVTRSCGGRQWESTQAGMSRRS